MPPYSPAFSPYSFSEPPGSGMPSPMLSPSSPFLSHDYGMSPGVFPHSPLSEGRRGSFASLRAENGSIIGNSIAQDVGLVALSLTEDSSRYIGPSSGCEFARIMFADCPPPDTSALASSLVEENFELRRRSTGSISNISGDSSNKGDSGNATPCAPTNVQTRSRRSSAAIGDSPERKRGRWTDVKRSSPMPSAEDFNAFITAFFENVHPHYPFLERNTFEACREVVQSSEKGASATFTTLRRTSSIPILPPNYTLSLARFQVFMVMAVGSSISSAEKGQKITSDSEGYFITAMGHVEADEVKLRGSLQGLQNLLLMAMYALHVDSGGGMSIWHLNSTVVAGCIELGLHKNSVVAMTSSGKVSPSGTDTALVALKRKVFWSIYALDRNLGIMLGRPFALDEHECDVELPDTLLDDRPGSGFVDRLSVHGGLSPGAHSPGGAHTEEGQDGLLGLTSFPGTVYLLQMIRITSIIKSSLYRISPVKPAGYPTPYWLQHLPAASQHNPHIDDIFEWQKVIHRYLDEIRQLSKARLTLAHKSNATYAISQAIELKFHEAMQLLYRPNPVIPQPSIEKAIICYASTVEMIRMYARLRKSGGMNHAWLSAQWVFLSGLSMVWAFKTSWAVLQTGPGRGEHMIELLKDDVQTCSGLLEEFGVRWKVMLRAKERFDGVARVTLNGLSRQMGTVAQAQPAPSLTPGVGSNTGSGQLLSPVQQYPGKHLSPSPRAAAAPQRNVLADLQNAQAQDAGRYQQQQLQQQQQQYQQQQQLLQFQQQQNFNEAQFLDTLFTIDNSDMGGGTDQGQGGSSLYNGRLAFSSQQVEVPLSSSPVDDSLLNQPLVIPIIRQSPTPTSETPTPMNTATPGVVDTSEWYIGTSAEVTPSHIPLQLNLIQQSNELTQGIEEVDLSWIADMDWTSPELVGYSLAGLIAGSTGLNENPGLNRGDSSVGGSGGGDADSKMWGMESGSGNTGH